MTIKTWLQRLGAGEHDYAYQAMQAEIDELRARLDAWEKQEPEAWRYQDSRGHYRYRGYVPNFDSEYKLLKPIALYTKPKEKP